MRRTLSVPAAPLAILGLLTIASGASAQQPGAWSGISDVGLTTIYVVDQTGTESPGVLRRLTPDSLTVLLEGGTERQFAVAQVRRVDKRGDSKKSGALIGGAVGALGAVGVLISNCESDYRDVFGDVASQTCGAAKVAGAIGSLALYTLLGIGLDGLHVGRTNIYRAPASSAAASSLTRRASVIAALPKAGTGGIGIGLRLRVR